MSRTRNVKIDKPTPADQQMLELLRQIERNTRHALTPLQLEAVEKESKP